MRLIFGMLSLAILLAASGCLSTDGGPDIGHRMPSYRPELGDVVLDGSVVRPTVIVAQDGSQTNAAGGSASTVTPAAGASGLPEIAPAVGDAAVRTGSGAGQRVLSRGDRVMISLRGIPRPEEMKNVIDGEGNVTLPYIGQVRVADLIPSEAERVIESAYIDGGIYISVNAIVVAEDKVYFVQGEVSRQGKFTMSGDVTLLQAITEAGGYTPWANRRNVKVIRGPDVLFFDAREVENGKIADPGVMPDDIIVVQKSII